MATVQLKDVNHIKPLDDFIEGGLAYLPGDFLREKDNLVKLLTIYLERLQSVDQMFVNLAEGRLIDNATNGNLDEIGRRLGIERNGMVDESYRVAILILLASSSKHGTRPEVIATLQRIFGEDNFSTWKGENYRVDLNISGTCFPIEDLLSEIKDLLPLPTHLRVVESFGLAFGFSGSERSVGFSSKTRPKASSSIGGLARLVFTSDQENLNK